MTCQWYKRQMSGLVCMVKKAVTLLDRPILLWENLNSSNDFFSYMDIYFILEDLFWCNIFSTKISLSLLVNFTSRFLMRFLYRYFGIKIFYTIFCWWFSLKIESNFSYLKSLYDSICLTFYNVILTSFPIGYYGLTEQKTSIKKLTKNPYYYRY